MSPSTRLNQSPRSPLSRFVTFSKIAYRGRSSLIRRAHSDQSPLRSPSIPAPFPATLMSWHGKPPVMTSTPIPSVASRSAVIPLTSSYSFTPGQFLLSTFCAYGSISQNATVSKPARSKPRVNPPIPANRSRTRIFCNIRGIG